MLKKLTFIAAIAVVIYIPLFSVKFLEPGEVGIVEDKAGHILATYTKRVNFVWQGSLFWQYKSYPFSTSRIITFNMVAPIPPLQGLNSAHYSVKFPVRAVFVIDMDRLFDREYLGDHGEKLDGYLGKYIQGEITKGLEPFFKPYYRPAELESKVDDLINSVSTGIKDECGTMGIRILNIKRNGNAAIPDMALYLEGVKFFAEERVLEHKNAMEFRKIKDTLERDKLTDEEFYKKLARISKIIKQNPDILKYIYIDKILGNAKVFIPSVFPEIMKSGAGSHIMSDGEIDNLR